MRVLSYMRTSSRRQAFYRQEYEISEFCRLNSYTEVQSFRDDAVSGRVEPWLRDGFAAMWDAAHRGAGDVIVFADFMRLTRGGPEVAARVFREAPVPLVFIENEHATNDLRPVYLPRPFGVVP